MQIGGMFTKLAHDLRDVRLFFEIRFHEDSHRHVMEDLVEDVAQFVEGIVLRAIHAQHAIVRPLPLVLFVVLAGMVKASRNVGAGANVRLHDTCARTLGTRMAHVGEHGYARTASLVPLFLSFLSV